MSEQHVPDPRLGVYGISVAADLVGIPQTLRLYEDRGLLDPARTAGGTRRYSQTTWTGSAGSGSSWAKVSTSPAWPPCWAWRAMCWARKATTRAYARRTTESAPTDARDRRPRRSQATTNPVRHPSETCANTVVGFGPHALVQTGGCNGRLGI